MLKLAETLLAASRTWPARVYPPALLIHTPLNVATPALTVTVLAPWMVPPPCRWRWPRSPGPSCRKSGRCRKRLRWRPGGNQRPGGRAGGRLLLEDELAGGAGNDGKTRRGRLQERSRGGLQRVARAALLIDRSLNVATPPETVTITVPPSAPLPAFLPKAMVTLSESSAVRMLPDESSTATRTAGLMAAPAATAGRLLEEDQLAGRAGDVEGGRGGPAQAAVRGGQGVARARLVDREVFERRHAVDDRSVRVPCSVRRRGWRRWPRSRWRCCR